jgi:hypothetical protein
MRLPRQPTRRPTNPGQGDEGQRHDQVVAVAKDAGRPQRHKRRQAERLGVGWGDQREGEVEDHVDQQVLEHRHREHDAGEAGAEDAQVGHDPGDHRDAGDRHGQREHQQERGGVVGRTKEAAGVVEPEERHPRNKRRGVGEQGDAKGGLTLAPRQDRAQLRTRAVQQQHQPELVEHPERSGGRSAAVEHGVLPGGQQQPEQGRAEQQAAQDLPGDPGLAQPGAQPPERVGGDQQQDQGEEHVGDIGVRQAHPGSLPAGLAAAQHRRTER